MTTLIGGALVCPLIIGRDRELGAIERCLEFAAHGSGQVITIAGEAGIGKSRVAREVAARAERLGWLVLEGRCTELDRPLAFAPVVDLLRSLVAALSVEEMAGLLAGQG